MSKIWLLWHFTLHRYSHEFSLSVPLFCLTYDVRAQWFRGILVDLKYKNLQIRGAIPTNPVAHFFWLASILRSSCVYLYWFLRSLQTANSFRTFQSTSKWRKIIFCNKYLSCFNIHLSKLMIWNKVFFLNTRGIINFLYLVKSKIFFL